MFVALLIIIFTCLLSVSLYLCLSHKQVATKQGRLSSCQQRTNTKHYSCSRNQSLPMLSCFFKQLPLCQSRRLYGMWFQRVSASLHRGGREI